MNLRNAFLVFLGTVTVATSAPAEDAPVVSVNGTDYATWQEFWASDDFKRAGRRCGTPLGMEAMRADAMPPGDCTTGFTNPSSAYDPGVNMYEIPVWVHIMHHTDGTGNLSDELVNSQIQALNEDFMAMPGTLGQNGSPALIRFMLAGITRTANNLWFADQGNYYDTLARDPNKFLNIYVNNAGGGMTLGYVPFLPNTTPSNAGINADRVVILYSAFGVPAIGGQPYNLGRTATHEVGHYLGLLHPFPNASACNSTSAPGCYSDGDLICDTNTQQDPVFGCPSSSTLCGTADPVDNYMNYTDDDCMEQFTTEQIRRMRCTIQHYRAALSTATPTQGSSWSSMKGIYR